MQRDQRMLAAVLIVAAGSLVISWPSVAHGERSGTPAMAQQQKEVTNEQMGSKSNKDAGANMVLVGELVDARDVTLKGVDEYRHKLLKVKPGDGAQTVIVDIGTQDAATSFGLVKGDRVIAVGKSARINQRPVLFAKSIGELYPVGRVGSVARDQEQMMQDKSARGATSTTRSRSAPSDNQPAGVAKSSATKTANASDKTSTATVAIDLPTVRGTDEIVVWFDTDNLASDQYGNYDEDFVWVTTDPEYSTWNSASSATAWNDNRETPHWDVWGYDDADEWGLFDW